MDEQGGDERLGADARRSGETGPYNSGVVQERVVIADRPDRSRTVTTSHVRPGGTRSTTVEEILPSSRIEAQMTAAAAAEMAPPPRPARPPPQIPPPREGRGYEDDPHQPRDDETNAIGPDGPSQSTTERIAGRALIYPPSPTDSPSPRCSSDVTAREPQQ